MTWFWWLFRGSLSHLSGFWEPPFRRMGASHKCWFWNVMISGKIVLVKAANAPLMRLWPWQAPFCQMSGGQAKSKWLCAIGTLALNWPDWRLCRTVIFNSDMYLCPYSTWIFDVLWPWHVFMCLFYMDISCAMALTCIYILDLHGYLLHFDSDMYLYAYFTWMFVVPWSWHVLIHLLYVKIIRIIFLTWKYDRSIGFCLIKPQKPKPLGLRFELML